MSTHLSKKPKHLSEPEEEAVQQLKAPSIPIHLCGGRDHEQHPERRLWLWAAVQCHDGAVAAGTE